MNKIKITFIAAFAAILMVLPSSAEVRVGLGLGQTAVESDGTQTLKDSSVKSTSSQDESTLIPSLFVEIANDSGFGLGLEIVPGTADIGAKTRADDDEESSNGNKASAEINGLTSVYLMKTFGTGFFVKAGMTQTEVVTTEALNTGSTYGNETVTGGLIGAGFTKTNDNGVFFRASAEYTDYDNISLTSKTDVGGTAGSFNKISANVDTTAFKISIGKAF
tara:strand:- start:549 stop:1208 length:660 start_codon:yes stop_codon:yes gene_type:complete